MLDVKSAYVSSEILIITILVLFLLFTFMC